MVGLSKKHSMVMVQVSKPLKNHLSQWWPFKNINHSIALKNWPSLWSTPPSSLAALINHWVHDLKRFLDWLSTFMISRFTHFFVKSWLLLRVFPQIHPILFCCCKIMVPLVFLLYSPRWSDRMCWGAASAHPHLAHSITPVTGITTHPLFPSMHSAPGVGQLSVHFLLICWFFFGDLKLFLFYTFWFFLVLLGTHPDNSVPVCAFIPRSGDFWYIGEFLNFYFVILHPDNPPSVQVSQYIHPQKWGLSSSLEFWVDFSPQLCLKNVFQDKEMLLLRHFPAPLSYCSHQLIDITHTQKIYMWGPFYSTLTFGLV